MQNWINKQSDGAKILVFVAVFGVIVVPTVVLSIGLSIITIQYVKDLINPRCVRRCMLHSRRLSTCVGESFYGQS